MLTWQTYSRNWLRHQFARNSGCKAWSSCNVEWVGISSFLNQKFEKVSFSWFSVTSQIPSAHRKNLQFEQTQTGNGHHRGWTDLGNDRQWFLWSRKRAGSNYWFRLLVRHERVRRSFVNDRILTGAKSKSNIHLLLSVAELRLVYRKSAEKVESRVSQYRSGINWQRYRRGS